MRKARKLSLRELGALLDLSAAFIMDVERAHRYPSNEALLKMAIVFDVTFQSLKDHDERPPIDEIKRLCNANPGFVRALRKLVAKERSRNV